MKIAIMSDTHDKLASLEKALNYINQQKAEVLIHAGDLEHSETLDLICKKFHGEIHYVAGNADMDPEEIFNLTKIYPNLKVYPDYAELEFDGKRIAVTHKPTDATELAKSGNYDLVIHGHDHKPWQRFVGKCEILNPGNMTSDDRYPNTFAIYDVAEGKPKLVELSKLGL
jgi:hypothetical protein